MNLSHSMTYQPYHRRYSTAQIYKVFSALCLRKHFIILSLGFFLCAGRLNSYDGRASLLLLILPLWLSLLLQLVVPIRMCWFIVSASSSSVASSYTSTYGTHYNVFISHRGTDVRNKFASHLYRRLCHCGSNEAHIFTAYELFKKHVRRLMGDILEEEY